METAGLTRLLPALLLASGCFASLAGQAGQPEIVAQKIKDNIYMLKGGSGANTGLFFGNGEAVVIDAKMTAESAKQMLDEVRKLTPIPVTHVILTHSDRDHVDGLAGLPAGVAIIAQEQCKQEMEEAAKAPEARELKAHLPGQTFKESLDLKLGGYALQLLHFGPAHTSGDTVIYFPAEKVAFIGDLAFLSREPLVHRQKGGTSFGLAATLKKLLELDAEIFVSGHDAPSTKAQLQRLLESLEDKQAKVKALVAAGKSLAEVKAALGVIDEPGKAGAPRFPSLAEVIYLELTEKK